MIRKFAFLFAAVAMLGACASFPHAKFEASAFGASISLDTRTLTDEIGDATASFTEAVGLTTPDTEATK